MPEDEVTKEVDYDTPPLFVPEKRATGKYYLVLIAVDKYKTLRPLTNPVRDTNNVLNVLLDNYKFERPATGTDLRETSPDEYPVALYPDPVFVYNDENVTCLYNEQFTPKNLSDCYKRLKEKMTENDSLLIWYSGHGIHYNFDNKFYVTRDESIYNDSDKWMPVETLVNPFVQWKDATGKQQCKDLLLVLDCCFAGQVQFGFVKSVPENFSRYVLTSCKPNQPASDGVVNEGSPFANAMVRYLLGNENPYTDFEETEFGKLKGLFFEETNGKLKQTLSYEDLPSTDQGTSRFTFERREKDKPAVSHFVNSVLLHLNYHLQRGQAITEYSDEHAQLNIFTTQGESIEAQKLLLKVLLNQIHQKQSSENAKTLWQSWALLPPMSINKVNDADDIWRLLHANSQLLSEIDTVDKENVVEWCYEKLLSDRAHDKESRHAVLMFTLDRQATQIFKQIKFFCLDFHGKFQARVQRATQTEIRTLANLFLIFTDQRPGPDPPPNTVVYREIKDLTTRTFNFVETLPIGMITKGDASTWVKEFAKNNKSTLVQQLLKDRKVLENIMKSDDFKKTVDDFVERMCCHCKFTLTEKTTLVNSLYELKQLSYKKNI